MAKQKNKKADNPIFGSLGCIKFDGNLQIQIPKHGVKTLRTDLGGMALQSADPNKELIVLVRDHVGYNELDTGYIVRTKLYGDGIPPYFGLKATPDALSWGCHNFCDVIAWGYADGGLNDPTLFYSCQSTMEEEAERERRRAEKGMKTHAECRAELEAAAEEFSKEPPGLILRFRHKDEQIQNESKWTKDMGRVPEGFQAYLKAALEDFLAFTKEHPEFKEMHFYTDTTEWEDDGEEGN